LIKLWLSLLRFYDPGIYSAALCVVPLYRIVTKSVKKSGS